MATVDEFIQMAGKILEESGFEFVDSSGSGRLEAIRNRQSSVLMMLETRQAENGEWLFMIRAFAVTNFELPNSDDALKLLALLSDLNRERYFGTWYVEPSEPAIVLDHTLLAEHMTSEELAMIVKDIEEGANAVDEQLSSFLQGETALETLQRVARQSQSGTI